MARPLIVKKFGGTSVGSPERILKVAALLAKAHQEGERQVVVVSAMGHTTDELIRLAEQVSKAPPKREMDMLLTTGERVSMALLSMALSDLGVPAISLTGSQSGIITDSSHSRARIKRIRGDRIKEGLEQSKIVIVAGFQGVSEEKEITTLGRGGSDTTAVALACTLGADRCDIFTDVDGVFSADPRLVEQPRFWSALPADLMTEMALYGAGVLHPRCVELASEHQLHLFVKNTQNHLAGGTQVIQPQNHQKGLESYSIVGVTQDPSKILIEIRSKHSIFPVLKQAEKKRLQLLASSAGADAQGNWVKGFASRDESEEWKAILSQSSDSNLSVNSDLMCTAVVGYRFGQDLEGHVAVLGALETEGVLPSYWVLSPLSIVLGVPKGQAALSLKVLHQAFDLKPKT